MHIFIYPIRFGIFMHRPFSAQSNLQRAVFSKHTQRVQQCSQRQNKVKCIIIRDNCVRIRGDGEHEELSRINDQRRSSWIREWIRISNAQGMVRTNTFVANSQTDCFRLLQKVFIVFAGTWTSLGMHHGHSIAFCHLHASQAIQMAQTTNCSRDEKLIFFKVLEMTSKQIAFFPFFPYSLFLFQRSKCGHWTEYVTWVMSHVSIKRKPKDQAIVQVFQAFSRKRATQNWTGGEAMRLKSEETNNNNNFSSSSPSSSAQTIFHSNCCWRIGELFCSDTTWHIK